MSVRFVFPKLRLTSLLKTPGGLPVGEAIEQAAANLRALQPDAIQELHRVVEQAEAAFTAMPHDFDETSLAELYTLVSSSIGVGSVSGVAAADTALVSLSSLLDHLMVHRLWDRPAVEVHVQALRLLLNTAGQAGSKGESAVLDGLRRVSERYAPVAAA